jgi:hypothetical protein
VCATWHGLGQVRVLALPELYRKMVPSQRSTSQVFRYLHMRSTLRGLCDVARQRKSPVLMRLLKLGVVTDILFVIKNIYYRNIKARFSFHLVYILHNTYLPLLVFRDVTHHLLSLRFLFLLFLSNRYPQLMVTKAATTVVLSSILTTTRLPTCTSRQT